MLRNDLIAEESKSCLLSVHLDSRKVEKCSWVVSDEHGSCATSSHHGIHTYGAHKFPRSANNEDSLLATLSF